MAEWPCIVIAGPTATGKTALAVQVARALGSEIFSMDSRQVYRALDLGTGKDLEEYRQGASGVPYHLIDVADPSEIYGLYRFQGDCYAALEDFRRRRGVQVPPVLAGGTGLYLEAVLRHYEIPAVPEDATLRAGLMQGDIETLREALRRRSPERYARTDLSSKKRVVRSLEIAMHSDPKALPERARPTWTLRPLLLVTQAARATLHDRIACRLQARLQAGLVDEVQGLRARGLSWERLDQLGMEYRHVAAHLRGERDFADMTTGLGHAIQLLAKRQETYFRGMARRGLVTQPIGLEVTRDEILARYENWCHEHSAA